MNRIIFKSVEISRLSFGTVQLGLNYGISNTFGKPTQKIANEIIDYLMHSGINCFDTAITYGNSEEVLGNALKQDFTAHLVSKIKSDIFLTNPEEIIQSSLCKLKSPTLFGLLLHDTQLLFDWKDEYTDTIQTLQNKQLIDHFGVSIYTSEEFDLAITNPMITIIQIPFNIFDQRAVNGNWFLRAKQANKLIFIRSIFLQGLFFMQQEQLTGTLQEAAPYLQEIHRMAAERHLSITELALAYVHSVALDNAVILFGCDTLEQAKENIYSFNRLPKLNQQLLDTINKKFSSIPDTIINPTLWRL